MIQGRPVNLTDMLAAREERARQQHALRQAWNLPLLSFCLNIPGPSKQRRCLLCGRQAQDCARSRRHTVEALTAQIKSMLRRYYD